MCLILLVHTAAAYRNMLQEVPATTGPAAAPTETPPTPLTDTTDRMDETPELETEAIPGGRAGYDYPDRIPGPPELDPNRQGMYKGMYR